MTIKALYPTVRPTLNLDFAKTKVLDPRITFTRASTATFVGANGLIQTAASGVARFDHNPATGESLGLLVEEARTNLITYSQDFNSTNYATGYDGGAFTVNAIAAPDGTVTASKLTRNAGTAGCWWGKFGIQTIPVVSGTAYTVSCYLKAAEISTVRIIGDVRDAGGLPQEAAFTLAGNGSYTLVAGTSAQIVNVGNGWYRCSVTGTADATVNEEPTLRVLGTGTSGEGFYAWGFQLEAGSFPTSYIPTTTATVTRAADVASITGTNFSSWYNQSAGTMYLKAVSKAEQYLLEIPTTGGGNYNVISINSARAQLSTVNTTTQASIFSSVGSYNLNVANSVCAAWTQDSFAITSNGTTVATDTSGTVPTVDLLAIGRRNLTGLNYSCSTFARLTYYPVRLPDATLQAITAT